PGNVARPTTCAHAGGCPPTPASWRVSSAEMARLVSSSDLSWPSRRRSAARDRDWRTSVFRSRRRVRISVATEILTRRRERNTEVRQSRSRAADRLLEGQLKSLEDTNRAISALLTRQLAGVGGHPPACAHVVGRATFPG